MRQTLRCAHCTGQIVLEAYEMDDAPYAFALHCVHCGRRMHEIPGISMARYLEDVSDAHLEEQAGASTYARGRSDSGQPMNVPATGGYLPARYLLWAGFTVPMLVAAMRGVVAYVWTDE